MLACRAGQHAHVGRGMLTIHVKEAVGDFWRHVWNFDRLFEVGYALVCVC